MEDLKCFDFNKYVNFNEKLINMLHLILKNY